MRFHKSDIDSIEKDLTYGGFIQLASGSNVAGFNKFDIAKLVDEFPRYIDSLWRISPLLIEKTKQIGAFEYLSHSTRELLIGESHKATARKMAEKKTLDDIVSYFSEYQIPIILLKGTAYRQSIYHGQAARLSRDVDILVKKNDWVRAQSVLESRMVYRQKDQPGVLGDSYEKLYVPKGNIGLPVDLHYSVVHPELFEINEDSLWKNSSPCKEYNSELVRILSIEHSLIILSLHSFKDLEFSNYCLIDLNALLNQNSLDTSMLWAEAEKWGAEYPLIKQLEVYFELYELMNVYLTQEKPDLQVRTFLMDFVLKFASKERTKVNYASGFGYRLCQFLSHFIFTSSLLRPLTLHAKYACKSITRRATQ